MIGWYNGWGAEQRIATASIQREAIVSGALTRPRTCSICLCGWTRPNPVWLHDENHADPLAAYPICRHCHRILHERFDQPGAWLELVALHSDSSGDRGGVTS